MMVRGGIARYILIILSPKLPRIGLLAKVQSNASSTALSTSPAPRSSIFIPSLFEAALSFASKIRFLFIKKNDKKRQQVKLNYLISKQQRRYIKRIYIFDQKFY